MRELRLLRGCLPTGYMKCYRCGCDGGGGGYNFGSKCGVIVYEETGGGWGSGAGDKIREA